MIHSASRFLAFAGITAVLAAGLPAPSLALAPRIEGEAGDARKNGPFGIPSYLPFTIGTPVKHLANF